MTLQVKQCIYTIIIIVLTIIIIHCLTSDVIEPIDDYDMDRDNKIKNPGSAKEQIMKGTYGSKKCSSYIKKRGTDYIYWGNLVPGVGEKKQCMECLKYSTDNNVVIRNMVKLDENFTSSWCDAIAAGCGRKSANMFYANSNADWSSKCSVGPCTTDQENQDKDTFYGNICNNGIQEKICWLLSNSIIQYFLNTPLFVPVSCGMKIMGYKVGSRVQKKWNELKSSLDKLNPLS